MTRKKTRFLTVGLATYAYPMLGSIGDINKSAPVSVYMFSSSPVTLSDSYTIISSEEEFLAFAGDADGWDKNTSWRAISTSRAGRTLRP